MSVTDPRERLLRHLQKSVECALATSGPEREVALAVARGLARRAGLSWEAALTLGTRARVTVTALSPRWGEPLAALVARAHGVDHIQFGRRAALEGRAVAARAAARRVRALETEIVRGGVAALGAWESRARADALEVDWQLTDAIVSGDVGLSARLEAAARASRKRKRAASAFWEMYEAQVEEALVAARSTTKAAVTGTRAASSGPVPPPLDLEMPLSEALRAETGIWELDRMLDVSGGAARRVASRLVYKETLMLPECQTCSQVTVRAAVAEGALDRERARADAAEAALRTANQRLGAASAPQRPLTGTAAEIAQAARAAVTPPEPPEPRERFTLLEID